ncbi:MAG TPA: antitoxin MazE-like protein [Caulobacteraceae bacterium]|nr:antitoxin MazE-like protein [Caulobacteraceae bacterium]
MSARPKPTSVPRQSSAARTRAYRERLRAQGLKPLTIWTYDINDPAFQKRLEEDCRRLRGSDDEEEVMKWLDEMRDTDGWV